MRSDSHFPSTRDPQRSTRSSIIVCEREPYWTPELQRQFQHTGVAVRGCRHWTEFTELFRGLTRAVQIVDLEHAAADCLTGLVRRQNEPRFWPLIVIASPRFAALEWVLREAGVNAFFSEHPSGEQLALCCRRWLLPESQSPRLPATAAIPPSRQL